MQPYRQNPDVYRKHFAGYGLAGFKGARVQRQQFGSGPGSGRRPWYRQLKRFAVPILKAGARAVLPHVSRGVRSAANVAAARFFPGNKAAQKLIGQVTDTLTDKLVSKAKEKLVRDKKPTKRKAAAATALKSKKRRQQQQQQWQRRKNYTKTIF